MRRPRRATPSRRQLALAAAAQAPLEPQANVPGSSPGQAIREGDPLTAHALWISHWLDTGEGEKPDADEPLA